MIDRAMRLAEKLATNVSESRRGFLGRLGRLALGVGGFLGLTAAGRADRDRDGDRRRRHCCATYTCVGDTVNVAARLEAHTKELNRPILIDENTRAGVEDGIAVEAQGELLMKGKTQPTKVYAVLVDAAVAETA